VHRGVVTARPLISCPPQCWQNFRGPVVYIDCSGAAVDNVLQFVPDNPSPYCRCNSDHESNCLYCGSCDYCCAGNECMRSTRYDANDFNSRAAFYLWMMDCTCGCATGNCPACYACLACCKCHATRPELDALQRDGMASSDLWQQTEQQTEQTEQQTDQTAPRKNSRKQRRARNCTHKAAASAEAVARAARADEATKDEQKKRKVIQKDRDAMKRMGREISWHHKPGWNGLRMSSDTWVVVKVRSAIDLELVAAVQSEIKGMPDSAFQPMGGQQHAFFDQKRRQHQFVIKDSKRPIMRLYLVLHSLFALVGYKCRGVFAITGGSHQFMHQDRGHYHSVSVFICITRRQVRFGQCGGPDIFLWMEAGDVIMFNGLVWHSGLLNDADSCVVFMYFDYEPFFVTPEMMATDPTADPSRFGFTKMYSEQQWYKFSADSDEKLLDIQDISDLRAAPTAILQALIPHDQWTLDT
jgi:hypothetical protein